MSNHLEPKSAFMKNGKLPRLMFSLALLAATALLWSTNRSQRPDAPVADAPIVAPASADDSDPARPVARRASAAAAAMEPAAKLTAYADPDLAPAWTVPFGAEFWRRETPEESGTAKAHDAASLLRPSFNLGDVMERVRHAATMDSATGQAEVRAESYAAKFDGEGLRFSPHSPAESTAEASAAREARRSSRRAQEATPPAPPVADPGTEIRFRTLTVQRDGESFYSADRDAASWSVAGNTAQGLLSQQWGLVEHYEARREGVSVTWVFPSPLPGHGPVEVIAAVEGLNYAGQTTEGHHFAGPDGTARVRVGQAFAVDANGQRWELAMNTAADNSGRLVVELPAEIQAEAAYPLVIDPLIGAEFGVNKPVSNPAHGGQGNPAVAAGTGGFLVVWEDSRNTSSTGVDIYGVRLSTAGKILDPLGLAICTAPRSQFTPAVAASGNTYLVVWRDVRLEATDFLGDIFGARVSSAGVVQDALGFVISAAADAQFTPAIAAGPSGFFVAWDDNRNVLDSDTDIFGARVTTAGVVQDPAGLLISANLAFQANATVAAVPGGYFVAWEDWRADLIDIYAAQISSAGAVLNTDIPVCLSDDLQFAPSLAAHAGGVLVSWQDYRNFDDSGLDIYATRVTVTTNSATVLDPAGIAVCVSPNDQSAPVVAANASGFLVAWEDAREPGTDFDIYATRISNAGTVLDPAGLVICNQTNAQTGPALAATTTGFFATWSDARSSINTGGDIFGAAITTNGLVQNTNGFLVSQGGNAQSSPAVAFSGTNYLVVWEDERNYSTNSTDLIGTRVSGSGKVLDVNGLKVAARAHAQRHPAVASSGGNFLVVWEDERNFGANDSDIFGTRVTATGAISDPAGLAISASGGPQGAPVVAASGTNYFVAWHDGRSVSRDIFGTLVSRAGTVASPDGLGIGTEGHALQHPAIAANANGFLIVWEDDRNDPGQEYDIFGARVDNAGTVLDASGLAICTADLNQYSPSVASLGTNFLVVWEDLRHSSTNSSAIGSDIFANLVGGDGSVARAFGFPICTLPRDQKDPVVAASQHEYLVLWQNRAANLAGSELASARVSSAGALLDLVPVPLHGSSDTTAPALAAGAGGRFLTVSTAFRDNTTRLALNVLTPDAPAATLSVQFSTTVYTVKESGKFAKVTVAVTGKNPGTVTVDFATVDETARAGADYALLSGRLVFTGSKKSVTLNVPIVEDASDEANETVTLTLRNPNGGLLLGPRHTATLTILDND